MNTLLILYLVYLSWGTVGQGRVSLLDISRYLRCSKTHMRKIAFKMADDGLIEIIETISGRGSRKLFMQLSNAGNDFLMLNFDAAVDSHHRHVALTVEAMKRSYEESGSAPKKLSKKQLEAIEAGQKELF